MNSLRFSQAVTDPSISRAFLTILLTVLCLLFGNGKSNAGQQPTNTSTSAAIPSKREGTAGRVRVAEGEYKVLDDDGIGPYLPAVYGFSESWTLWRLADGSFEVEGTRRYRSPSYESHNNEFSIHLSPEFRVLDLREFRKLRWRPDSGPLSCDFLPGGIACTSNAKDATHNVSLNLSMKEPFGFMWPISAFSLGSITRYAAHDSRKATPVELVRVEEASRSDPALATILSGDLKYIGEEKITFADRQWLADKFELKMPLHSPFMIWTSPQGLLLGFVSENNNKTLTQQGMKLVSFRQWKDF
ncbi:MAG: hypothetical protein ACRD3H_17005 [Terriglobales bacterium]